MIRDSQLPAGEQPQPTRAGHVALVGQPNVGKSTMLNALIGEKLSIVTPRAQTTRVPVTGILTTGQHQAIFVDTPGLLEPRYALQESMLAAALAALADADVVLLLLDAEQPHEQPAEPALTALRTRTAQLLVAINKVDVGTAEAVAMLHEWSGEALGALPMSVSALTGNNVPALRLRILDALPPNPFFFPEGDLATQPTRFFVEELVRETVFEEYEQEVPYSSVVRIEEYREGQDPIYIRATVYVERDTQKAILIGRGGDGIKRLGRRARRKIEAFLGTQVYLDLWVKTLRDWKKNTTALRYLGFPVPPGAARDRPPARATGRRLR